MIYPGEGLDWHASPYEMIDEQSGTMSVDRTWFKQFVLISIADELENLADHIAKNMPEHSELAFQVYHRGGLLRYKASE